MEEDTGISVQYTVEMNTTELVDNCFAYLY